MACGGEVLIDFEGLNGLENEYIWLYSRVFVFIYGG